MLAVLVAATALASLMSVCLFPQLMALSADFGAPASDVAWTLIVIDIMSAGVGAAAAGLGVVLGNRCVLAVSLGAILAGAVVCALAGSLGMLIAGRAVQGVGMAAMAVCIGIVATYWTGRGLRRAISMMLLAQGLGATLGYLLGGLLAQAGGDWRTMFWAMAPVAAAVLLCTLVLIRETPRAHVPVDAAGAAGLIAWATLLLLPLSQANSWGWASPRVISLFTAGAVVLALWTRHELRCPAPLLDLRLLRRTGVWQSAVVWMSACAGLYVISTIVPYLLQTPVSAGFGFGTGVLAVSLALAAPALVVTVLSPTTDGMLHRLGRKRMLLVAAAFGLAGLGLAAAHGSLWITVVWLALIGVPTAWGSSAAYAVAAEAAPPEQGVTIGASFQAVGGTAAGAATAIAGYLLTLDSVTVPVATADGTVAVSFPAESGVVWASLVVAAVAAVAVGCVLTIDPARIHVADRDAPRREPPSLDLEVRID